MKIISALSAGCYGWDCTANHFVERKLNEINILSRRFWLNFIISFQLNSLMTTRKRLTSLFVFNNWERRVLPAEFYSRRYSAFPDRQNVCRDVSKSPAQKIGPDQWNQQILKSWKEKTSLSLPWYSFKAFNPSFAEILPEERMKTLVKKVKISIFL